MKKLLTYVVDGVDSSIIRQIGENYLIHDTADCFERFTLDMVLKGALSIQAGDNPLILIEILASFTGIFESEKFIEKLHKVADEVEKSFGESGKNTISQDEIDTLLSTGKLTIHLE